MRELDIEYQLGLQQMYQSIILYVSWKDHHSIGQEQIPQEIQEEAVVGEP